MNSKGSVILHVLVTGILVALIAACLLRMNFNSYLVTARENSETVQLRQDSGALSIVTAGWNASGAVCSPGSAPAGFTCGGSAGTCNCTCTITAIGNYPTVTALTDKFGHCQLTIASAADTLTQTLTDNKKVNY